MNFSLILVIGTIAFIFIVIAFFLFLFIYKRRHNFYIHETQQMKHTYEQELLRAQLEIKEQTLKNISLEIHDNIGQILSLAKLNLATADSAKPESMEIKVTEAHSLISKAISDLRSLSRGLDTDYIVAIGLQKAIEHEMTAIQKSGTLQTNVNVEGEPCRLDRQKELILYRIVQETLHNIIKHSKASAVQVRLAYIATGFFITIADNGSGFNTVLAEQENEQAGLGIRNMQNRAILIGAALTIQSAPEKGTIVTIHLSKDEENDFTNKA